MSDFLNQWLPWRLRASLEWERSKNLEAARALKLAWDHRLDLPREVQDDLARTVLLLVPVGEPPLVSAFDGEWASSRHPAFAAIASVLAKDMDANGAKNYLEVQFFHPKGRIDVLAQWAYGESPAQQNARLRRELMEATAERGQG